MLVFQLKEENEMNAFFVPAGTKNVEEAKLKAKGLQESGRYEDVVILDWTKEKYDEYKYISENMHEYDLSNWIIKNDSFDEFVFAVDSLTE